RATARRGLRLVAADRLRGVELLAVLVDVELAAGALDAAAAASTELVERARGVDVAPLQARSTIAQARVLAASGDLDGAIAALEAVADGVDVRRLPLLTATVLVELARRREQAGDIAGAQVDARAAAAILGGLDVVPAPGDAELLRRLGAARAAASTAELARDGKWWVAAHGGTMVRLPDTKGLRYLAELVAAPGAERHVLALVGRGERGGE